MNKEDGDEEKREKNGVNGEETLVGMDEIK